MPFIAIALILAAAIGGGTSFAAQNALPGDALWGFKVTINENIRAAFASEGKAQANFDIEAIEARMKEAEKLSANGKADAKANADVEANIDAHVKSIEAQIARLQDRGDYSGAADVATRFQAILGKQTSGGLDIRATLDIANNLSADASAKARIRAGDNN